jgi:hypothetical protein
MSQNRTCGECKYFVTSDYLDVCVVECETRRADSVCNHRDEFKPKVITNGDRIRQMSNKELRNFLISYRNDDCEKYCVRPCMFCDDRCDDATLAWLNSPAEIKESEREDE